MELKSIFQVVYLTNRFYLKSIVSIRKYAQI